MLRTRAQVRWVRNFSYLFYHVMPSYAKNDFWKVNG